MPIADRQPDPQCGTSARHRDAERYSPSVANGKSRRNYADTSPITRASGSRRVVLARYRRLADAVYRWAFCAMRNSPRARTYYQSLHERGTGHQAALRQLGNRLVGILHGYLEAGTLYDRSHRLGPSPTYFLTTKAWDVCRG